MTVVNKDEKTQGIRQYHIGMVDGDVAEYVLLPGDPFRTDIIAKYLDDAELVAHKREHKTYTGFYKGVRISVTSTGMGCPSTAIAAEELANIGAKVFIRLGSCAALQDEIDIGDLVVTTGAMKNEGTSKFYVPDNFPAIADLEVTSELISVAKEYCTDKSAKVHWGITSTDDSFYGESPEWIQKLIDLGLKNIEMESSALFTVCHRRGLRGATICAAAANHKRGENLWGKRNLPLEEGIELETQIALETLYRLHQGGLTL
ncbi:nucleoside phosphorylase [Ferrimonas sp. SCSIO 43195]|uniref:nucleoside phosphorylase n=1 Tax=Ferrimonas sp. SCSIO 43195 TaxID=2822844 RepID=UPI002074BB9E|nr:nucleoside phosphorylase [Ferrimonas sp. SCSIO 43195]USD38113.1 nucleoside phosphorylase [Ferrimonas sp. SCSIO 43195]